MKKNNSILIGAFIFFIFLASCNTSNTDDVLPDDDDDIVKPVTAMFSVDVQQGDTPLTVKFTNESSNAVSYLWNFGDDNTSTEKSPVHEFINESKTEPRKCNVTLTCVGSDNSTANYSLEITINKAPMVHPIVFNPSLTYGEVTDIEGNVYKTIVIGNQTWMAQNLRTTKYVDGSSITLNPLNSEAGYYTRPSEDSIEIYGLIYNRNAILSNKICPQGWVVPLKSQLETLLNYAGGENNVGTNLKEVGTFHWDADNEPPWSPVTNSTGFTALPIADDGYNGFVYFASRSVTPDLYEKRYDLFLQSHAPLGSVGDFNKPATVVRCLKIN